MTLEDIYAREAPSNPVKLIKDKVRATLLQSLIPPQEPPANQEIAKRQAYYDELLNAQVKEFLATIPETLYQQLLVLEEESEYGPKSTNSHLGYELGMIRFILTQRHAVRDIIFPEQTFSPADLDLSRFTLPDSIKKMGKKTCIADLTMDSFLSDTGKAGSVQYNPDSHESVYAKIYNKARFFTPHITWMQEKGISENAFITKKQAITVKELLQENPTLQINALPIEIARSIGKAVACESLYQELRQFGWSEDEIRALFAYTKASIPDMTNISRPQLDSFFSHSPTDQEAYDRLVDILTSFSLSKEEVQVLSRDGFDITTTPMGELWTKSHLFNGQKYLASVLPNSWQDTIPIAMAHHFSQGEIPPQVQQLFQMLEHDQSPEAKIVRITLLRRIAFNEILDKIDAISNRGRKMSLELIKKITWTILTNNLTKFYSNNAEVKVVYAEVFQRMTTELDIDSLTSN